MTIEEKRAAFKKNMLDQDRMTLLCGAFDGITARVAQAAGCFDGCYMGGQATAASILGVPDIGVVTGSEQTKHAGDLASCVELPFVIDADTGYGNDLNVRRTMNDLELAGICGAHFEDQVTPKRCGGMHGVQIETAEVFARKIETAVKYRRDPNFLVIARSDAAEVVGVDEAIRRLNLAADAGADMGYIFSAKGVFDDLDDIKRACDTVRIPILYCLMEFCPEVCFTLEQLRQAGLRAVCWPNGLLMRWCRAATDLVEQFKQTGSCLTFFDQLMPIEQCNQLLGIQDWNPPGMF
ncbi:isocitrate lyase/PEP mutase family protein [Vermiculatibacterium agrestimuris]|jgi:2-methylisocitrate lyase-like PEP mutase family enzyme|uniref:isocitrate lyase/PEP mutase family protein n=1 Tax=Vermiculatibacterium agrestimuris TaxID=2941519 RepID=UPI00203A5D5F|nr:isocitrate lyase/PEP mutase family protein [Vermiculatibacterium agrestimuris]